MRIILFGLILLFLSCKSNSQNINNESNAEWTPEIVKTEAEWKKILSEEEFRILREEGTERPFTGDLLANKKSGIYTCAACAQELFSSDTKFESGTGWPSFYDKYKVENVHDDTDYKLGYPRTEVECSRCGGHLGHVFNDGPKPTGLRYCINSAALDFEEK